MRRSRAEWAWLAAVVAAMGCVTVWAASFAIDPTERFHRFGDGLWLIASPGTVWVASDYESGANSDRPVVMTPTRFFGPRATALFDWGVPWLAVRTGNNMLGDFWSFDVEIPGLEVHYAPPRGRPAVWSVGGTPLLPAVAALVVAGMISRRRRRGTNPSPNPIPTRP